MKHNGLWNNKVILVSFFSMFDTANCEEYCEIMNVYGRYCGVLGGYVCSISLIKGWINASKTNLLHEVTRSSLCETVVLLVTVTGHPVFWLIMSLRPGNHGPPYPTDPISCPVNSISLDRIRVNSLAWKVWWKYVTSCCI